MFDFQAIINGFNLLMSPENMLFAFIGVLVGAFFGALPGFTASMGIAVLLPLTYAMEPAGAIIMLAAIYCGCMYGGSIPAILVNTPGTPGAAATTFDGYPMAKKGLAHKALITSAVASAVGGFISAIILLFSGPVASYYAIKFGPAEMFLLAVWGLTALGSIGSENIAKGMAAGIFGLLLSTIGMDYVEAFPRMTFDILELYEGIPFVPALIGMLAFSECLVLVQRKSIITETLKVDSHVDFKTILEDIVDVFRYWKDLLRSSLLGSIIGAVPGEGAAIANYVSYDQAKRFSPHPEKFGTGIVPGVIASEASNNAVTGGAFIPTLALGIPGSSSAALLLGALMIHGIRPGPGLFHRSGDVMYAILLSLFITNILILLIGCGGAKYFSRLTKVPSNILVPIIVTLTIIGSFAVRNLVFDVLLMIIFGIIGFFMQRYKYPPVATVLGLVLGPIAEQGYTTAMSLSGGSFSIFFGSIICWVLWAITLVSFFAPLLSRRKKQVQEV